MYGFKLDFFASAEELHKRLKKKRKMVLYKTKLVFPFTIAIEWRESMNANRLKGDVYNRGGLIQAQVLFAIVRAKIIKTGDGSAINVKV